MLSIAAFLFGTPNGHAQLSKGHQILLNRGLQLQGLSQDDCYLHLDTFSNANYTSINWINSISPAHSSRPTWMGDPPGFPWARWVWDETQMPPQVTPYGGDETPFLSQLLTLQLGDEWNLNDDATRTRLVNWFNAVRTNWPNTILYHNNWGSQIGDTQLADFYTRARPDMLCFDTYPWQSVWDVNQPDHTGPPIPGPPTGWYGDVRRYREHARGAGIPLAIYRQTFHAVQDYDQHVFRDPSPSELRLNTFAALAFNTKFLVDFVYNTGANSFFTNLFNGAGDTLTNTSGLYAELTDANRRARNLGRALVRLQPIGDVPFPDLHTTSMMMLRGRNASGTPNPIPVGFIGDPQAPDGYTDWVYQRNDPYLSGWAVTNTAGVKNAGTNGDVILAWFKPLDESFDGPNYTNQIYMMVVNGLTDPTGSAADCLQEIRLDFSGLSGAMTNLVMLDPVTGQLQTNGLPPVSSKRRLTLNLNGGDAVLFKFNTGAPFVGFETAAPARLNLSVQTNTPVISIEGTTGAHYQLQGAPALRGSNWTILTNLLLPSSPCSYFDTAASNASKRFYRAVETP
jgi:hypothetical protein